MNNSVGWFELYVQDMQRARSFYENVLSIKLERLPTPDSDDPECSLEMWAFPMSNEVYGAGGALVKTPNVKPGPGGTLVYFNCEDCAVEAARVTENGGQLIQDKMSIGDYGFVAMFNDTEGNMLGLHSMQ